MVCVVVLGTSGYVFLLLRPSITGNLGTAPVANASMPGPAGSALTQPLAGRVLVSSVSIGASKDNTLFESASGSLSNGAGSNLFVGRTNAGNIRRGVIAFDVAGNVPTCSMINSVTLTLDMSMTSSGAQAIELHKLLADWGEGTSNSTSRGGGQGASATVGDATWVHTFFNTATWDTAGGDFLATGSASASVGNVGDYTWGSAPQMVADVQGWLDDPSSNFGWLFKGNETQNRTTKRFDTRENGTAANRPVLMVDYAPAPCLQFSSAAYEISETGGMATITVTRTGSSAGEVMVDHATSDGTATSGDDYVAASGTISFADGDTGDKTFDVFIIDDGIFEGDETVNLTLSNVTGTGALGSPNTAVLAVTNDDIGDINQDGFVDPIDLRIVVANFGPPPFDDPRANVNGDHIVDVFDLAMVARNLGLLAPQPLRPMVVQRAFPNLIFERMTNLVQPDDGHNHIFVTEQPGRIRVFTNDRDAMEAGMFLDISGRVSESNNEEGLLGLAFDPDYSTNGYFYVYYSAANPRRSVVSRFSVSQSDPEASDPESELVILEIGQPFGNHNGGQLAFGPDGYLYISVGDGGSGGDPQGHGQNKGTLLGSILRIDGGETPGDLNYRIPNDNPFAGLEGARGEIWAYGLRNPWRFSFDKHTGTPWAADVGQNKWEEIDILEAGRNYGWNTMEGLHCFSPSTNCDDTGLKAPLWEYGRADGCSITGGYVYRGRGMPWLLGAYVYGDFCSGKIWGLRYEGGSVTEQMLLVDTDLSITSFGQDLARNLYILSRNEGIYQLVPAQ